ncbi:MAG TPA: PDZ domain-containing protein [Rhodanobacteraceae bacterium]
MSRDSRLLLLVVIVSGLTLAVLARFRFPGEQRAINPSPAPLERLAARATYDDLASIVAQLQTRVASALHVVRVVRTRPADGAGLSTILDGPDASAFVRLALAIRLPNGRLLAHLERAERPDAILGVNAAPTLVGYDPLRLVAVLSVPESSAGADPGVWQQTSAPSSPRYVAVAEATQGGPAVRPLFIGRTDPYVDRRWNTSLLALGGAGVTQAGSFVFSLDGSLEGLAIVENGLPALAPTAALLTAADDVAQGRVASGGDLGIEYDDLTTPVAAATGAAHGAVVSFVRPDGPAAGALTVGDVVAGFNGATIDSAEDLTLQIARTAPGAAVTLDVVRRSITMPVPLVVAAPRSPAAPDEPATDDIGMTLRTADQTGAEVLTIRPGSPAADAGVAPRDLITDLDGAPAPSAAAITRAFKAAESGTYLLLGITRRGDHLVAAVRKP